jgi:hypothetical protein
VTIAVRVSAVMACFSAFVAGLTLGGIDDPIIPWWVQLALCGWNLLATEVAFQRAARERAA